MQNKNWKYFLILIGVGIVIALLFFKGCINPTETEQSPKIIQPKAIVKDLQVTEKPLQKSYDSLFNLKVKQEQKVFALENEKTSLQSKYAKLNLDTRVKQVRQQIVELPTSNDFTITERNQLEADVTKLLDSITYKTDLCDSIVYTLQSLVEKKTEIIVVQENLLQQKDTIYNNLKSHFDLAITNSENLQGELKKTNRKLKWKKVETFAYKVAAIVAGVFILKNNIK